MRTSRTVTEKVVVRNDSFLHDTIKFESFNWSKMEECLVTRRHQFTEVKRFRCRRVTLCSYRHEGSRHRSKSLWNVDIVDPTGLYIIRLSHSLSRTGKRDVLERNLQSLVTPYKVIEIFVLEIVRGLEKGKKKRTDAIEDGSSMSYSDLSCRRRQQGTRCVSRVVYVIL